MPQSPEHELATHQQVQGLVAEGRLDEAVGLCEQWVAAVPDRALPLEWLVQCLVRRDGVASATSALEHNLARPDLPAPARAAMSAILAMYRLPVLPFGAWAQGGDASLALAEAGATAAADVRWAKCALAIARAYQGRADEARRLALQVLSRPQAPEAERCWMLGVIAMCEAGTGATQVAQERLEELRRLDPGNRLVASVEQTLAGH